jgi:hypothetical protein
MASHYSDPVDHLRGSLDLLDPSPVPGACAFCRYRAQPGRALLKSHV